MHYLTYVFITGESPVESAVSEAMTPFAEDLDVRPWKRHLGPGEVEALATRYRLSGRPLTALAGRMEEWTGWPGGVDENGLFEAVTYNPDGKWDWYEIGGRWAGRLPENRMTAASLGRSQLLKTLLPHDFITPDGVWHAKARPVPGSWPPRATEKSDRRWLAEFRASLEAYPGHSVVTVDRHS